MAHRKDQPGSGQVFFNALKFSVICFLALFLLTGCPVKQPPVVEKPETAPKDVYTVDMEETVEETSLDTSQTLIDEEALRIAKNREKAEALKAAMIHFEEQMIHFDYDSAVLTPAAQNVLRKKAGLLRQNPSLKIRVAGYCDERGSIEYNLALGERRAMSAKKFLVHLDVDQDRIATISFGKEDPIDPGQTEAAWAKNRRDEFLFIK